MALTPKSYGIASGTVTVAGGFTGSAVETLTVRPVVTIKELTGNNVGQSVIDRRYTEKKEEYTFTAEFEGYNDPLSLYGLAGSVSIVSDDVAAQTISSGAGIVTAAECTANKDTWWQYTMTITTTP